jgi:hypothetical protein
MRDINKSHKEIARFFYLFAVKYCIFMCDPKLMNYIDVR